MLLSAIDLSGKTTPYSSLNFVSVIQNLTKVSVRFKNATTDVEQELFGAFKRKVHQSKTFTYNVVKLSQ